MLGIPPAKDTDAEDVAWGLQTAEALWKRGERIDAVVWLRRAAQAAGEAADDDRALELARSAAELSDWMAAQMTAAPPPPQHTVVPSGETPRMPPNEAAKYNPHNAPTFVPGMESAPFAPSPFAPSPFAPSPFDAAPPSIEVEIGVPDSLGVPQARRPLPSPVPHFPAPLPSSRPSPPANHPPSSPTMQTAGPVFGDEGVAAREVDHTPPAMAPPSYEPHSEEESVRTTTSVPPADMVHAGMFNPWDENAIPSAPAVPPLPAAGAPPPAPRFASEEEEVITSVRPHQLAQQQEQQQHEEALALALGLPRPSPSLAPDPAPPPPQSPQSVAPPMTPSAGPPRPGPSRPQPPRPPPLPPRAMKPKAPLAPAPTSVTPPAGFAIPPPGEQASAQALSRDREPADAAPASDEGSVVSSLRDDVTPVPRSAPPPSAPPPSAPPPSAPPPSAPPPSARPPPSRPPRITPPPPSPTQVTAHPASARPAPALAALPAAPEKLDLDNVEAFADLPDDARSAFAAAALVSVLGEGEEVSSFALAYILSGSVDVAATMVDAAAARLEGGAVLRSRGTTDEGVPMRLIGVNSGVVATWTDAAVQDAFRTCPWVEEDLRTAADRIQTSVGVTIGPLGERLDAAIREEIIGKLTMRTLTPGEIVVTAGEQMPGLLLVGVGELELVDGDRVAGSVGSGEFVFPTEVLGGGDAPYTARAGAGGALILFGDRRIAQELMVTCPPLLEVFAGM